MKCNFRTHQVLWRRRDSAKYLKPSRNCEAACRYETSTITLDVDDVTIYCMVLYEGNEFQIACLRPRGIIIHRRKNTRNAYRIL